MIIIKPSLYITSHVDKDVLKIACESLIRDNSVINNNKLSYIRQALSGARFPQELLCQFIQRELSIHLDRVKYIDRRTLIYPNTLGAKGDLGRAIIELFEYESLEFLLTHKEIRGNKLTICLTAFDDSNGLNYLYSN